MHRPTTIATVLLSMLAACAPASDPSAPLPIEDIDIDPAAKADHLGLELTRVSAAISQERLDQGGTAVITSAESWEDYMGTPAPDDVDFTHEWVAFFGTGVHSTGGYTATIEGILNVPSLEVLVLDVHTTSPGFDCLVTQVITRPYEVVKFEIPEVVPTSATTEQGGGVKRCSPSPEELQSQLDDSRELFDSLATDHDDSYQYTRVTHSFFANSTYETTFVVEEGVVVLRSFESNIHGTGTMSWIEVGEEVGTHESVHDVATLGDAYDECAEEVLTLPNKDYVFSLSFDEVGLLRRCTARHRFCADDCDRGPVISEVVF